MDPETFSITDKVRLVHNTLVEQLLYYDQANNNVVFYGLTGGIVTQWGTPGFYSMSLDTGQPKSLMEDPEIMPGLAIGTTNYNAIINRRYAVTTRARNGAIPGQNENDTHTFIAWI